MVCKISHGYFIVSAIFSAVSVSAIAGVCILFLLSSRIRSNPSYRYIFYLLTTDLIIAIGGFFEPNNGKFCQIAGLIREYAILSSLLWTAGFTLLVYNLLRNENLVIEKYEKIALICCYGIPLFIALPFVDFYGDSGYYCWLSDSRDDKLSMTELDWLAFFIELILGTLLMVYGLIKSYFLLKKEQYSSSTINFFYRMLYYPLILIFVNIIDLIERAMWLENEDCMSVMGMFHIITIQSQGFFNCLGFCLNSSIRNEIIAIFWGRRESMEKSSLLQNSYVEYEEDSDINTITEAYDINENLSSGPKRRFTIENE